MRKLSRVCSKGTQAGDIRLRRCLRSLCRRVALMRLLETPAPGAQLSDRANMSSWIRGGVETGCDQGKAERAQSQRQWQSGQRRAEGLKRLLAPRFHAHCPRKCRETAHARQCTSDVCLHQGQGRGAAAATSANRAPRQREQHWMGGLGFSPTAAHVQRCRSKALARGHVKPPESQSTSVLPVRRGTPSAERRP